MARVSKREGKVMSVLIEVLALGAAVAIGVFLLMYLFQDRLLFYPPPAPRGVPQPDRGVVEEISLMAGDGVLLSGWFVKIGDGPVPLAMYFGGNAEDISWLAGLAGRFSGYSLMLINYRGYAGSAGKPEERSLFADALLAYDWAARRQDVVPGNIVAIGRSLGSGVAVHLAANRNVAGVVLVSPYDSVRSIAQRAYPWLPVAMLLRHPFDSLSKAGAISAPLLCLVADRDDVIPSVHSRRLFEAWGGMRKTWVEVPMADHDSIAAAPGYWDAIARFLSDIGSARTG